ncbi:MAG: SusD/RagB family nutrient-binding outer membrane lipoprotein [Draconibacterium sp.]
MKKLISYFTVFVMVVLGTSCTDQLRIDERQTSFDVNYFSYSRYQLTTAIVDVAKNYGSSIKEESTQQCDLYFLDCYSGDQIAGFYTNVPSDWSFLGSNPYNKQFRTLAALTTLAKNEENMATVAAANILKCVVGAYLTEKYGDIPFTEAAMGREGNLFPKFDSQKEVYETMFDLLDEAISILSDGSSTGIPADHDVLFAGDKTKWLKFANSLKFRLMVHSYEAFKSEGRDLASEMQAIASGNKYMSSVDDNASLDFSGSIESESWYLQTNWGTGNEFTEQKPTKYLIDHLVALDDPRLYVLFAPALTPLSDKAEAVTEEVKINGYTYSINYDPASNYDAEDLVSQGRNLDGSIITVPYVNDAMWFGAPNPINLDNQYAGTGLPGGNGFYDNRRITGLSTLISETTNNSLRAVMMESSEMMFLLAEARQRGWISAGSVEDYYNEGIKLSFERWQIVDGTKPESHIGSDEIIEDFDAYCAKAGVALDGTNDLEKIALQKWFALLLVDHTEAFTDILRTGRPSFVIPVAQSFSIYDFPQRYVYPLNESSNNKENYDAAVTSIGGKDIASAKMWIRK